MEKNIEYPNFNPYMQYDIPDGNDIYRDPMFNPVNQYKQAYTYYKYLCMQMDYKIKCKEYEKLCRGQDEKKNV